MRSIISARSERVCRSMASLLSSRRRMTPTRLALSDEREKKSVVMPPGSIVFMPTPKHVQLGRHALGEVRRDDGLLSGTSYRSAGDYSCRNLPNRQGQLARLGSANVLCRSHAGHAPESVNEMGLIVKPAGDSDFCERHSSAPEQGDGSVNPQPQDKLMWWQAHR